MMALFGPYKSVFENLSPLPMGQEVELRTLLPGQSISPRRPVILLYRKFPLSK